MEYLQTQFDKDIVAELSRQWKKNVNHTSKAILKRRKSVT